ncbi:D-2-hydroxyacid dehydrogenase [Paenibacillus sp. GYB003]|uniref:D-2-hydroxyacid dehydrogenase n=1 Tax=Paenibacillus sp. GYB003 TaxID=2994392 RepID=UPI002F96B720
MTKRIMLVLHELEPHLLEAVRGAAPGFEVLTAAEGAVEDRHYAEAEIICGWNAKAKQLAMQPGTALRWIQTWGAGIERLPLAAIKERGIWLTNASGVHPKPISESVFAMVLAFTRKLHVAIRNQQERVWEPARGLGEAHGKTMTILGVGEIGKEVAKIAKAFGMRVLGVRKSGAPAECVDRMATFGEMAAMLAESDYVVNCLPLTDETRHIVGKEAFAAMKRSAFYVNIGRGGTTDTDALVDALREGRIAGAGLDVFEQEPLPADHPLWAMDNVIMTPHHTGITTEYDRRVADIIVANLAAYREGREPPVNRIPADRMY